MFPFFVTREVNMLPEYRTTLERMIEKELYGKDGRVKRLRPPMPMPNVKPPKPEPPQIGGDVISAAPHPCGGNELVFKTDRVEGLGTLVNRKTSLFISSNGVLYPVRYEVLMGSVL